MRLRGMIRLAGSISVCLALTQCTRENAASSSGIAAFVTAVLPQASSNFEALRGLEVGDPPQDVFVGYELRVPERACSGCYVYDRYGRGTSREYWSVGNAFTPDPHAVDRMIQITDAFKPDSTSATPADSGAPIGAAIPPPPPLSTPPEWPMEKTESYVIAQLAPVLAGYAMRHSTSPGVAGGEVPTLIWNALNGVWVEAKMYPQMAAGVVKVGVLVGHDLATREHVLAPPSPSDLGAMRSALANATRAAVAAAPRDFSDLRGGPLADDVGHLYGVKGSFGPGVRTCVVLDIALRTGSSFDSTTDSPWAMLCRTPPVLGLHDALLQTARAGIAAGLPAGFTAVADSSHRTDALWRNNSGITVGIDWGPPTPTEDVVSFTLRVTHIGPTH